jgi:hypothetical protein
MSFLIKVELEGVMKERKIQLRHSGDNRVYRGMPKERTSLNT